MEINNSEGNKIYSEKDVINIIKWYNETQFRAGKGDPIKILFCKSNYKELLKQAIKELNGFIYKY